ncbi:hypothetical protein MRX96_032085 [Rhipicephalus microplus]
MEIPVVATCDTERPAEKSVIAGEQEKMANKTKSEICEMLSFLSESVKQLNGTVYHLQCRMLTVEERYHKRFCKIEPFLENAAMVLRPLQAMASGEENVRSHEMAAPRLEAAIVRCSSSTECCQEFPAADPDRSGWNPTLQVLDSASVFDLKIPPPDLRPEIRPSRSSSEDIEALNPIVLDTTEPYQTTIMLSHADTRLPRNVSFEKAQIPSYAEATAIENLPRTSPPAVSSQHTMFAHDSSPEATGSTTSGSSAVGIEILM